MPIALDGPGEGRFAFTLLGGHLKRCKSVALRGRV